MKQDGTEMIAKVTQTKAAAKKAKPKTPKVVTRPAKSVGEPIDKSKTYTSGQLRRALAISRATLHRYMTKFGLKEFVTPLLGHAWQITGEQYAEWLKWRRDQVSQSNG